ncbi:MAG: hypothetical protein JNK29_07520 [Anaerolineales bacterium]|nr:hypothetical protein [Anaerolineales bacterium]
MSHACPQCGAVLPAEETCQDRFTVSQLREIEQPAYYAVHHLSVPCYRLQHNGYSRLGWLEVRQLLFKFIYENWTPAMARRQARISADSGQRTWSFTKGPKLAGVEHIAWSLTIADVRLDTAENYGADVIAWAKSILADSEPLVRSAGPAAPR